MAERERRDRRPEGKTLQTQEAQEGLLRTASKCHRLWRRTLSHRTWALKEVSCCDGCARSPCRSPAAPDSARDRESALPVELAWVELAWVELAWVELAWVELAWAAELMRLRAARAAPPEPKVGCSWKSRRACWADLVGGWEKEGGVGSKGKRNNSQIIKQTAWKPMERKRTQAKSRPRKEENDNGEKKKKKMKKNAAFSLELV